MSNLNDALKCSTEKLMLTVNDKKSYEKLKISLENLEVNADSTDKLPEFVVKKIFPLLFDLKLQLVTRNRLIDIAFILLNHVTIEKIDQLKVCKLITDVEQIYLDRINELAQVNFENWDKLWIFLVRFCSRRILGETSLTNKFLRTIEVAFRSSNISKRLRAFDCWLEWIDLWTSNANHVCTPKELKILITPLKALTSRMPIIVLKRCETFVYLLAKLNENATLCFKDFLEFAFHRDDENNKTERLPEVLQLGTKVLIVAIGHNHLEQTNCVATKEIRFKKQIINGGNFKEFSEILITAANECCNNVNKWESDTARQQTIIQCIWRQLLLLIQQSDAEAQEKSYLKLHSVFQQSYENIDRTPILKFILGNIFCVLTENENEEINDNIKELIFNMSLELLQNHQLDNSTTLKKVIEFIASCSKSEKMINQLSNYYKLSLKYENTEQFCDIWLKISSNESIFGTDYLLWPLKHYQSFISKDAVKAKWLKVYMKLYDDDEDGKIQLIKKIIKLFQENPLLDQNIIEILLHSNDLQITSAKIVEQNLKLFNLLSSKPNLSDFSLKTLSVLILSYIENKARFNLIKSSEDDDNIIKNLCQCLENMLTIHKQYQIIPKLYKCFSKHSQSELAPFASKLTPILENLFLEDDSNKLTNLRGLMELFDAKVPNAQPIAKNKNLNTSTPIRSVQTSSIGTRSAKRHSLGSLNDRNASKHLKTILDDNSSDYVKVNTVVKFEPQKLSKHQREAYEKRREDIPALYEDLSQSQSRDVTNVESNDASEVAKDKKTESNVSTKEQNDKTEPGKNVRRSKRQNIRSLFKENDLEDSLENKRDSTKVTKRKRLGFDTSEAENAKTVNIGETSTMKIEEDESELCKSEVIINLSSDQIGEEEAMDADIIQIGNDIASEINTVVKDFNSLKNNIKINVIDSPEETKTEAPRKRGRRRLSRRGEHFRLRKLSQPTTLSTFISNNSNSSVVDLNNSATTSSNSIILGTPTEENALVLAASPEIIEGTPEIEQIERKAKQDDDKTTADEDASVETLIKPVSVTLSQLPEHLSSPHKSYKNSELVDLEESPNVRRSPRNKSSSSSSSGCSLPDTESLPLTKTSTCKQLYNDSPSIVDEPQSMSIEYLSPIPKEVIISDELPTSPINCDTPDRTMEFLNSTSDISPIKCQENGAGTMSGGPSSSNGVAQGAKKRNELKPNLRVARLLQMANPAARINSPSDKLKNFIKKRCEEKKEEELEVLTFSREIPSPLVLPSSGILKRKKCNDDNSFLPNPKRKRVNFSDPAITEKKVFIKESADFDENEYNSTVNTDDCDYQFASTINGDNENCEGESTKELSLEDDVFALSEIEVNKVETNMREADLLNLIEKSINLLGKTNNNLDKLLGYVHNFVKTMNNSKDTEEDCA